MFYRLFFIFAITVYTSCNLNQPNTTDFKDKTNIKPELKSFRTKATEDKFYLDIKHANVQINIENDEFSSRNTNYITEATPHKVEIIDIKKFFRPGYRAVIFGIENTQIKIQIYIKILFIYPFI